MSNSNILNAAPLMIYRGVNDISGRQVTPEPEAIPMHFPFYWTFASKGRLEPQIITDNGNEVFGADTFDYRKKFANHQTPFITHTISKANACIIKRLIAEDAKRPTMVLWCAVSETAVSETVSMGYKREIDTGAGIASGETVQRRLAQWFHTPLEIANGQTEEEALASLDGKEVGKSIEIAGTQVAFKARAILAYDTDFGELGNNIGFNIVTPTIKSAQPVNDELAFDQQTMLHEITFYERADIRAKPRVLKTVNNEQSVQFSFKPNAINRKLDMVISFDNIINESYVSDDPSTGLPPIYGPYNQIKFFRDNYLASIAICMEAEKARFNDGYGEYLYNIFGCEDIHGSKYYTFRLVRPMEAPESLMFGGNTIIYAQGGEDGTCDNDTFNELVSAEIDAWGDKYDLLDVAYWPYSTFWDSGFDIDTKKQLITLMGKRKDVWVALSTHVHGSNYATPSEEQSVASSLKTFVGMYPESTYFGTPFMRGICMPGSAKLINSKCPWRVPALIEVLNKVCKYMGNGEGVMRKGKDFDMYPGNSVEVITDVDNSWKPVNVRNKDWALGLSTIQRLNRSTSIITALQTMYDDDTSVANAAPNMWIAVSVAKQCHIAWSMLTGSTKLTRDQFVQRSDEVISELLADKFDSRCVIVPRTYYTKEDSQRGYSWHCEVLLKMNNQMTVGTYSIVVDRLEG